MRTYTDPKVRARANLGSRRLFPLLLCDRWASVDFGGGGISSFKAE